VSDVANTNEQGEPKPSETALQSLRNFPPGVDSAEESMEYKSLIEPVFGVLDAMPPRTKATFWNPV
jgi:hypothetical protein